MKKILLILIMACAYSLTWGQEAVKVPFHDDFEDTDLAPWYYEHLASCSSCLMGKCLKVNLNTDGEVHLKLKFRTNFDTRSMIVGKDDCVISDFRIMTSFNDGIYISDNDGNDYTKIYEFSNSINQWHDVDLNLTEKFDQNNLNKEGDVVIQIRWFEFHGISDDCYVNKFVEIDDFDLSESAMQGPNLVSYAYDKAGNRIGRIVRTVTVAKSKSAQLNEQDIEPDPFDKGSVIIAPNPTKGRLKVIIEGENNDEGLIYVMYNSSGSKIQQGRFTGNGEHPIDLSQYKSGIYILHIKKGHQNLTYKIIKE